MIRSFRFDPPELSEHEAKAIARDLYGVEGSTQRLRGERSHNTRFITDQGDLVLRVASAAEPDAMIECHAAAIGHIGHTAPSAPVARMIPSLAGELVPAIEREGLRHRVRLETFLPGVTFHDEQIVGLEALGAIGEVLGTVAAALSSFDHPAAHEFMPWDIANGLIHDAELVNALESAPRELYDRARPRLDSAATAMATLPRQVVHNDGHAGNLLRPDTQSEQIVGLIDFGDLVHTVVAADIAVAGASLAPHHRDPLRALAALTAGYHRSHTLSDADVSALPDLVLARLVLSMLLSRYQIDHASHIAEAVEPEYRWSVANLARWLDLDPAAAVGEIAATIAALPPEPQTEAQ